VHLVITDSGLGGLAICAGIERALRRVGPARGARLTYVNAWPEQGRGYNDLPDVDARAAVFDRVLRSIVRLCPDLVVIACNTLSIVYEHTAYRRDARVPVRGIVDAGVSLFADALRREPGGAIVLVGTRTTIGSGVHRDRLLSVGIAPARVTGASCHGLATAIERGPHGEATADLIGTCAERAAAVRPEGTPLFLGLCCTHYGMVADRLRAAVQARVDGPVETLDPNARLVQDVVDDAIVREPGLAPATGESGGVRSPAGLPVVRMVSKVALSHEQRSAVAAILEETSPRPPPPCARTSTCRSCSRAPGLGPQAVSLEPLSEERRCGCCF
jgi:glutamate racemase